MDTHHLVNMANDIANFFEGELGKEQAHQGIHLHISRYWDPRMRREIISYVQQQGDGDLLPSAARAIRELAPVP
jgi:formate dehydrogenase subunit delta